MRAFADLFDELDQTTSTNEKIHAMAKFFRTQDPETCAWTLYFLTGRRPKQLVGAGRLRTWAQQETGLPDWLMEECYGAVGDTAEMVALILESRAGASSSKTKELDERSLGTWMNDYIFPLKGLEESEQKRQVTTWWKALDASEIFVLNKFLTGGLRVGVSETLVLRALEEVTELPRSVLASRILGNWTPTSDFFKNLSAPASTEETSTPEALPKPFCLASPLEEAPHALGRLEDWQVEWKWDGIRCQIVKTPTDIQIWSRGEERITDSFPDLVKAMSMLPGSWTLDGEVVAGPWRCPEPFQNLQRRLNRKKPSAALQAEVKVSFLAYDFLRSETEDISSLPLVERRRRLERFLASATPSSTTDQIGISPLVEAKTWDELAELRLLSRQNGAEGLMIKNRSAPYEVGRKRGIWFKWKVDPLTLDVVLTAAQPGTGRRASLYTDYTFSIWKEDQLVPIAKAYSGLSDAEIRDLDQWIRKNTTQRFGPVRGLKPERVYEIGFEGIAESSRHKSGYALRFPRILRERTDKSSEDADSVESLESLLRSLFPSPESAVESRKQKEKPQMSFALSASERP